MRRGLVMNVIAFKFLNSKDAFLNRLEAGHLDLALGLGAARSIRPPKEYCALHCLDPLCSVSSILVPIFASVLPARCPDHVFLRCR